jgi:hypothetical protein
LAGWNLVYGEKKYPIPSCKLNPDAYLILCSKISAASCPPDWPVMPMNSFPTLLNSGKTTVLATSTDELICCLDYSDQWYDSPFKAAGGWSLECIDLSNLSGSGSNWTASVDVHGGTPGRGNSVLAPNPAFEKSVCTRLYVTGPMDLEVHFSSFMETNALKNVGNYDLQPRNSLVLSADFPFPDSRIVRLHLSDSLRSELPYELFISGMTDFSGTPMNDTSLAVGLPEKARCGSLQLNEVLFNPKPGGYDYIEFVNIGKTCIDLSDIWLTNRTSDGLLNAGSRLSEKPLACMPGSYWLLTESVDSVCKAGPFPRMPNVLELNNLPSMPDDVGNVVLVTTASVIVDAFDYSDSMHFALISDPEGVALEKNRPEAPGSILSNWLSANAMVHYGTPGYRNSQYVESLETVTKGFHADPSWLTPDNDGADDRIRICYELGESGSGTLRIFDMQGRLVRTLANNDVLSSSGSYWWDGVRQDGKVASPGRYLLLAEARISNGKVIRSRLVLTVLF